MGSRGSFLKTGGFTKYEWNEVGKIAGIKIIEPTNKKKKPNLPGYSNTPGTAYILMKNGVFNQYRQYGEDRKPLFDIDFSMHGGKITLHMHGFTNSGRSKDPIVIVDEKGNIINKKLYNKFKKVLKGVKAND